MLTKEETQRIKQSIKNLQGSLEFLGKINFDNYDTLSDDLKEGVICSISDVVSDATNLEDIF